MLIHKAFQFRVYPTPDQEARLNQWDGALRFLWNLANEQRKLGLLRTDKLYPSASEQMLQLTTLRAELPWLADVPRNVCDRVLVDLDLAWQGFFRRISSHVRWKQKGVDFIGLTDCETRKRHVRGSTIHFPKLGLIRAVIHRPLIGKPKRCTLKRDGDQWFASILCEIEVTEPASRTEPVIALDRGITFTLADSDGNLTANPKHYEKAMGRLARAQRVVSRRKKGSKNREKAKLRVMRIHRKVRRQREHFLHVQSARLAKSHGVVVIEKLNVEGMKRGNLSRSIAGAGWSSFAHMLGYKLQQSGGRLVEVPAAYSSQTCSACGHVDKASRSKERFCCTSCGHLDHADLNAAKVLKQRYEAPGNPWCLPVEAGSAGLRSGKAKVKLRTMRKRPLQSPVMG